jgi:Ca2+-binding RTX toxin-like protein
MANNIPGTPGNDRLTGTPGDDIINRDGDPLGFPGTRGNDELFGGQGNDSIYGGPGNDLLAGMSGDDLLYGGSGDDEFQGSTGNDQIYGEDGNDLLRGFTGDDVLNGGSGNDLLNGGSGSDLLDGGGGIDAALYSTAIAGVSVNLSLAAAQNTGGAGFDTLANIENVTGSNYNDTLTGNRANNVLDGGGGTDTASYSTAAAGVIVNLGLAAAQNTVGAGLDTLLNIENLTGSSFADTLTGNGVNNVLSGLVGNDRLLGGNGNDTLLGGVGNDRLDGGTGNDQMNGGDGYDLLNGGAGADSLTGGVGADTFLLRGVIESQPGVLNRDVITDFKGLGTLAGDQINLAEIDANVLVAGNQAFTYIGGAAFTAAGQVRYAGGVLQGSTDADTAAEFEIQLLGTPALTVGGPGGDILL